MKSESHALAAAYSQFSRHVNAVSPLLFFIDAFVLIRHSLFHFFCILTQMEAVQPGLLPQHTDS